jgi:hypothetical protein
MTTAAAVTAPTLPFTGDPVSHFVQAGESARASTGAEMGTAPALFFHGWERAMPFMKTAGLVLMAILPGGLVFLMAFVLARLVAQRVEEKGLRRAFATLKWTDFVREAKRL